MVKLLIGAGANPGMRNSENKTPQDLAQEEGHQMIVEFFKQLNA
jgi:ankyrin repeat protein